MQTTIGFLNDLITREKLTSIEKLAQLIGVSRQAMHRQLDGHAAMAPIHAVRVAYLLHLPPLLVIAATQCENARNKRDRETWTDIYNVQKKHLPSTWQDTPPPRKAEKRKKKQ